MRVSDAYMKDEIHVHGLSTIPLDVVASVTSELQSTLDNNSIARESVISANCYLEKSSELCVFPPPSLSFITNGRI